MLYDALDIDSLDGAGRSRAHARLAVGSALFGLLRADDLVPAYRLSAGSKLPGRPSLAAHWRPPLEPLLAKLAVDDLVINTSTFEVERAGVPIKLTATEFALARHLAENARRVCSKQELLSAVWGEDFAGGEHVVELYISYLRKKIDADGLPLIRTVRGIGYTMRPGA